MLDRPSRAPGSPTGISAGCGTSRLLHLDLEEIYRESTRCLGDLIRHFSDSAGTLFGL